MLRTDKVVQAVMRIVTGFAAGILSVLWILSLIPAVATTAVMVLFMAISGALEEASKALWGDREKYK